jgi:cation diffusion facilitator family transporter
VAEGHSTKTVVASIIGTAAMAALKFLAAGFSGSAAMLAEGSHSLIDAGNSGLLWLGLRLSRKPADAQHPFGHGMELYFWTLIVAVLIVAVGGGVTIAEGIFRVLQPEELTDLAWNYTVLAGSALFNGYTWVVAFREFRASKGPVSFREGVERAKDPSVITVLFEDSASLVGLVFAFLGIFLGSLFDAPYLDGVASILIGLLLGGVAVGLVNQSKTLLLGESANPEVVDDIRALVEGEGSVEELIDLLTMHFAPQDVLLNLKIHFRDDLSARDVEEAVDRLEQRIRDRHPEVKRIFIEPGPAARPQDDRQGARASAPAGGGKMPR